MSESMAQVRRENLIKLTTLLGGNGYDALHLQSIARRLHRIDERLCNGFQDWRGYWDEAATDRAEKAQGRLEASAERLAAAHGLLVYAQGDPRGWPLHLYRAEDLAREEYSIDRVYTRVGTAVCPH